MKRIAICISVLAVAVAFGGWLLGMRLSDGAFTYPLDDAYIHLQIARTFAESGTWGIAPGVPNFASSSPLWTLVLSVGCLIFGAAEWLPFVLSYLFSVLALLSVFRFWKEYGVAQPIAFVGGLAFVFFVPFITLTNLGMEHALHVFCMVSFLYYVWRCSRGASRLDSALMLLFAFLSAGARYESLFIITPVALLMILPSSFGGFSLPRLGLALLAVQFLPIAVVGLFAVSCGRPFFPVSLLLKANLGEGKIVSGIISLYLGLTKETVHFHVLVGLLLFAAVVRRSPICAALAVAAVGHGVFARLGWLYRYEAYLVACGIMVFFPVACRGRDERTRVSGAEELIPGCAFLLLVFALAFPFVYRSFNAHYDTIVAQREINAQQRQMGRIFATLPSEAKGTVAIADLGCVAFYSGSGVLDLTGLGTPEVADIRLNGYAPEGGVAGLFARNQVRYFAFFDSWYDLSPVSSDFKIVAALDLRDNPVICSGSRVLLGVMHAVDAPAFASHLHSLERTMPSAARLTVLE